MRASTYIAIAGIISAAFCAVSTSAFSQTGQPEYVASQSQVEDLKGGLGIGQGGNPVPMPPAALLLVKYFESWVPNHYDDPSNYCTIGYGHLIALKPCKDVDLGRFANELTLPEGEKLLDEDTLSARIAVGKLVTVDITREQFGALASFTFNVGKANFEKSLLLKLLNGGDFKGAGQQFGRWTKSKGVVLNGLVTRRSCEAAMFEGVKVVSSKGKFLPDLCVALGIGETAGAPIDIETGK